MTIMEVVKIAIIYGFVKAGMFVTRHFMEDDPQKSTATYLGVLLGTIFYVIANEAHCWFMQTVFQYEKIILMDKFFQ